jgi:hypothetical protein
MIVEPEIRGQRNDRTLRQVIPHDPGCRDLPLNGESNLLQERSQGTEVILGAVKARFAVVRGLASEVLVAFPA